MKKFKIEKKGYSVKEVNAFVSSVAEEYEKMLQNLKAKDQRISELESKLLEYQNMEKTLNRALLIAEDASTQIKKMAREESKSIIDDAKRNASRIVNDALIKAEKIESEAMMLSKRVSLFKRNFKTTVETELEVIENIEEEIK